MGDETQVQQQPQLSEGTDSRAKGTRRYREAPAMY